MTCTYFHIIIHSTAYHHLQITWLSYFGSENQGLPLRSWFVTCWLWRHIPIVTSLAVPSSCVATQTPMGTNSGTRRRKRKFLLLFVNCDRGRIEIDHLYGLCCRGWYCNPEQHSLCRPARPQAAARRPAQLVLFRIAVPTTPAQTVSWSIPITIIFAYLTVDHELLWHLWVVVLSLVSERVLIIVSSVYPSMKSICIQQCRHQSVLWYFQLQPQHTMASYERIFHAVQ